MGNRHSRAACFPELDQESTHHSFYNSVVLRRVARTFRERSQNVLRMFGECSWAVPRLAVW